MKEKIIFKNYSSRIIFSIVNLILGFTVTPWLIKYLGKEDFSLYKLTFDWLSSIGFLEQALTSAVLALLAQVSNEKRDAYTYYTFKKIISFSIIFLILAIAFIPLLPYLYYIPTEKLNQVRMSFFIGSFSFIFLPITVLKLWIEFHEKSYVLNSSRILQNIFQSVAAIALAYFAYGIVGQFVSLLMGHLLFSVIIYSLFMNTSKIKRDQELTLSEKMEFNKVLASANKEGLVLSLSSKLSFFSDTLLLGFFFNPVLILPFTLTQKLIQMIQENLQSLGNSSWSSLIDLYRSKRQKEFENQLITLTRINVFIAITLLSPLLFLNKFFIKLWVGEQFYAGFLITLIAILNCYFMSIFSLWGWCLSGAGKIKKQIPIYLLNAIINFSFGILFIKLNGLAGPIIGTLSGFLFAYAWQIPKALNSELEVPLSTLYRNLFLPLLFLIPIVLVAYLYQDLLKAETYFLLIIKYAFFSFSIAVILFLTYLKKTERDYVLNKLIGKFRT